MKEEKRGMGVAFKPRTELGERAGKKRRFKAKGPKVRKGGGLR